MGHGSLALLDYRRRVASHYAEVREGSGSNETRWQRWREKRDQLFKLHSESPIAEEDRGTFGGLRYFDYDASLRFEVALQALSDSSELQVRLDQDGELLMQPLGKLQLQVGQEEVSLTAYWLSGYGGGIFLPFRDATNGAATYGGGRYLLDTIKGADLGSNGDRLILDFNYAYNPSCAYNPYWHCPLAPSENWLSIEINAGELDFGIEEVSEPDPTAIPKSAN